MKKKILLLAMLVLCAAIAASGTLAYFTADRQVHNVITSGGVDITIEEWQKTAEGLVPYPAKPIHVMPSTSVSKIATVKNEEAEAWIRAGFEIVIQDADKKVMDLPPETIGRIVSLTMNETDWLRKEGDSDWWYYKSAVKKGDSTSAFFTEVIFDGPNMTNEYQNCTVLVIVKAQAVQTANNTSSVLTASGWPKA